VKCLGFERAGTLSNGRRIRRARFEQRSNLPVSAACVVGNGMREVLASLLRVPVDVRLHEPQIPDPAGWTAIARGAQWYRVHGPLADAAIVLRPRDAAALLEAAFGEPIVAGAVLSAIEREVLNRLIRGLAGTLAPVNGLRGDVPNLVAQGAPLGFVTYFEVAVTQPVRAAIGVALARDPQNEPCGGLTIDDLGHIEIELTLRLAPAQIPAGSLAALQPGAVVPMTTEVGSPAAVCLGGHSIARAESGARNGRYAARLCDAPGALPKGTT
jgi:flagellar motor switch/type III secretory pathway protein FliN